MQRGKYPVWVVLGTVAAALVWGISAIANYHAGLSLAPEPRPGATSSNIEMEILGHSLVLTIGHVFGMASICFDVAKVAMVYVLAVSTRERNVIASVLAVLILAMTVAWSIRSATYFFASAIEMKITESENASKISSRLDAVVDLKMSRAQFAAGQSVRISSSMGRKTRDNIAAINKQSQRDFQGLVSDIENDIRKLQSNPPPPPGDPIAKILKIDQKSFVIGCSLFFALLLEVLSSLGPWVLSQGRVARVTPALPERVKLEKLAEQAPQELSAPAPVSVPVPVSALPEPALAAPPEPKAKDPKDPQKIIRILPPTQTLSPFTQASPTQVSKDPERRADIGDDALFARTVCAAFTAHATGHMTLREAALHANRALPAHRRLPDDRAVRVLAPIILARIPGTTKVKTGGQMVLHGLVRTPRQELTQTNHQSPQNQVYAGQHQSP